MLSTNQIVLSTFRHWLSKSIRRSFPQLLAHAGVLYKLDSLCFSDALVFTFHISLSLLTLPTSHSPPTAHHHIRLSSSLALGPVLTRPILPRLLLFRASVKKASEGERHTQSSLQHPLPSPHLPVSCMILLHTVSILHIFCVLFNSKWSSHQQESSASTNPL